MKGKKKWSYIARHRRREKVDYFKVKRRGGKRFILFRGEPKIRADPTRRLSTGEGELQSYHRPRVWGKGGGNISLENSRRGKRGGQASGKENGGGESKRRR